MMWNHLCCELGAVPGYRLSISLRRVMAFLMLRILSVSIGPPNNRGFDIFIEGDNVEPLYVTPGKDEIDIKNVFGN